MYRELLHRTLARRVESLISHNPPASENSTARLDRKQKFLDSPDDNYNSISPHLPLHSVVRRNESACF